MYSYTFSEGWPPWPPVLGEVSWDSSSPSFNRCQAARIQRQLNGRMEKPKPRGNGANSGIFIHPKGWKHPHVQRAKSLNLPGRVSSNLYDVLGDRVLKIQRGRTNSTGEGGKDLVPKDWKIISTWEIPVICITEFPWSLFSGYEFLQRFLTSKLIAYRETSKWCVRNFEKLPSTHTRFLPSQFSMDLYLNPHK